MSVSDDILLLPVLEVLVPNTTKFLRHIFNRPLTTGSIPQVSRKANTFPHLKTNKLQSDIGIF